MLGRLNKHTLSNYAVSLFCSRSIPCRRTCILSPVRAISVCMTGLTTIAAISIRTIRTCMTRLVTSEADNWLLTFPCGMTFLLTIVAFYCWTCEDCVSFFSAKIAYRFFTVRRCMAYFFAFITCSERTFACIMFQMATCICVAFTKVCSAVNTSAASTLAGSVITVAIRHH